MTIAKKIGTVILFVLFALAFLVFAAMAVISSQAPSAGDSAHQQYLQKYGNQEGQP